MDEARWKRVSEIFHAARDIASDGREEFLRVECGNDSSLREEVGALLDAEQAGNPLTDAVAQAAHSFEASSPTGELIGQRVGPYIVVREIGRGGMGSVFLANRIDGEFEQQVALKLVRRGMDSEQIVSRFRQERQILATLHHPNIARLLDGGVTDAGQPFFALEYVEGKPIDEYCDAHRLTIGQRLSLFLDVCRAVMHAHRQLIIHRDLKPDNILVTSDGNVRLLDFGIAKVAVDAEHTTNLTESGLWVMTPAYASPEQVRGDAVGTPTDVYSLGMILYELLVGVRPYEIETRSPTEVERVVCGTQPPRPSTRVGGHGDSGGDLQKVSASRNADPIRLRRQLVGDLDVICLKALQKEPERRYRSVEAFADDIARHISGLPVHARPDSMGYRLGKAIRRHRVAYAAAAAVVLGVSGLVGFYTVRLANERDRARIEATKAQEVSGFLLDLFAVSDPSQARGETVTARELLDEGVEQIDEGLANQPEVRAELMRVMGEVYSNLGLFAEAKPLLERALAQQDSIFGAGHEEVATSQIALATVLQDLGEMPDAGVQFEEGIAKREQLFGMNHPAVSEGYGLYAHWLELNGDYEESVEYYRRALALDREFFAPDDARVIKSLVRMGGVLRRIGNREEAEPLLREGLAMQRLHFGDVHPDVASTARNLASLLRDIGEYAEADSLYREALETRRRVLGPDHPDVATTLNSYAQLLELMDEGERAIATYREMIQIYEATYDGLHPNLTASYSNLAGALRDNDEDEEAIRYYELSMTTGDQIMRPDHPDRAFPRVGLAFLYLDNGDPRRAEVLFREALAIRQVGLRPGHRYIGETLSDLGLSLADQQRWSDAEAAQLEAYELLLEAEGAEARRTQRAEQRLAEVRLNIRDSSSR